MKANVFQMVMQSENITQVHSTQTDTSSSYFVNNELLVVDNKG